ncbi:MAG: GNAT family N-acetyltransferase [Anaerolineae bacterium]|jgi:hypothetical protein
MASVQGDSLKVRSLLSVSAPADAVYAYYAFYHDRDRTELRVHEDSEGRTDGFVAVCQTGRRLFEPTVVLRTPKLDVGAALLREALSIGRTCYLITTPDLRDVAPTAVEMQDPGLSRVYEISLSRFEYAINVMVVAEEGIEGRPRFLVRSGDEVVAEAGLAWLSPHFASVQIWATPPARERGLGAAVLSACTRWVVRSGRHPLASVEMRDTYTTELFEEVGYVDSGARELSGDITRRR